MSSRKRQRNLLTAFNLVPVVEQVLQDREVECACSWEKNLYIGTSDGLIVYYGLVEGVTPLGKPVYQSKVKGRKQLDADKRKSVQQLTVLPTINRLLALLDGSLYLLDMQRLEIIDAKERINKVACYCTNESKSAQQSISIDIVLAQHKKKSLHVYNLINDRFVAIREISVADLPVAMARDGDIVCVALSSQHFNAGRYSLINLKDGGDVIDLPSFAIGSSPIVKRTARNQFLINTGDIGVVVTSIGESDRPPIDWSASRPSAAALVFPYLLTFSKDTSSICAYSLLDQHCVQEIPFLKGKYFSSSYGKLIAAVFSSVYFLVPVPLKEQVTQLLEQQYVEEAILLAETVAAVDEVKDQDKADRYLCGVKERAAFIYFSQGQFSKMEALLMESSTDPREVISKFDSLRQKTPSYVPQIDVPSAEVLGSSGQISLKEAKLFLIGYLKEIRLTQLAIGIREEIDTALVKVLAEEHPSSLASYITNTDLYLNFEETKEALKANSCNHALAMLYHFNGRTDAMMRICTEIHDGKLTDKSFPGLDYIVTFLRSCQDKDIVQKYSTWTLDHDEEKGVLIFTEEPEQRVLSPTAVLDLLSPYDTALILYLEYLVYKKNTKEEICHTRLGSLYLDKVLHLKETPENKSQLEAERKKLRSFLESSTHYRASFLLNRVQDTDLYQECAILYGRMEEHQKALTLLAHELQDYDGAEQYCILYSKNRSRLYCQNLYQTLLAVYLRPPDSSKPPVVKPALRLLNTHGANFDASKVLQLLPPQWEISTVKDFLMRSLRNTTNTMRMVKIEQNLAKGENLQARYELLCLQGGPAVVSDNKVCPVCQVLFTDATAIVRYPNGIVTHLKCGRNKNICPVTGTWFGE